ncbi:MAG TPA: P-II family nitrogen regulator [Caldilineaceae bacterium]|nr:P-II family nitrogen regulator [Caldilineaceae bacterium]
MREIKAYLRINMLTKVIRGLEDAGFTDMTVIDVKAIRHGLRDEDLDYSVELAERYMNVAKLDMVVRDADLEQVLKIIQETARTGRRGDGLIYVSPVEEAVHIRTGMSGEAAVVSPEDK